MPYNTPPLGPGPAAHHHVAHALQHTCTRSWTGTTMHTPAKAPQPGLAADPLNQIAATSRHTSSNPPPQDPAAAHCQGQPPAGRCLATGAAVAACRLAAVAAAAQQAR
eukprot:350941-Chlamydomonas_euryale.AAC.19